MISPPPARSPVYRSSCPPALELRLWCSRGEEYGALKARKQDWSKFQNLRGTYVQFFPEIVHIFGCFGCFCGHLNGSEKGSKINMKLDIY